MRTDGASVLVVGEALVDIVGDGVRRATIPGGSAANVALGTARRGIPVRLATWLAHDEHGDLIAGFLGAEGVEIDPASFGAAHTSAAIARRGPTGDVDYRFDVEWRLPPVAVGEPSFLQLGSFPAFASDLEELLGLLRATNAPRGFDPNIRPALLPDPGEARERFATLCGAVEVVKLSDADAELLLPGCTVEAVLDRVLELGARLVVVTLAERGLLVADRGRRVRVPAPPVMLVDTIGAGDTVMTSLVADLVERRVRLEGDDDLLAIGRRAVRAAAITVSRPGADLPYADELAR